MKSSERRDVAAPSHSCALSSFIIIIIICVVEKDDGFHTQRRDELREAERKSVFPAFCFSYGNEALGRYFIEMMSLV